MSARVSFLIHPQAQESGFSRVPSFGQLRSSTIPNTFKILLTH